VHALEFTKWATWTKFQHITAIDIPEEYKQNYNATGLLIDDMVNLTLSNRIPADLVVRGFVLLLLGMVIA
jgi:hypothetical protein